MSSSVVALVVPSDQPDFRRDRADAQYAGASRARFEAANAVFHRYLTGPSVLHSATWTDSWAAAVMESAARSPAMN